jgi:hypothetical protein
MKCPQCQSEMQAGTVRVDATSMRGMIWSKGLFFSQDGASQVNVLPDRTQCVGHRCVKCNVVVLLDCPPVPSPDMPVWVVCIAEQQQNKAPRQDVYDCLREQKIPHPLASQKAREFHGGLRVEIPLQDAPQAHSIADGLRALGLEAALIVPDDRSGPGAN